MFGKWLVIAMLVTTMTFSHPEMEPGARGLWVAGGQRLQRLSKAEMFAEHLRLTKEQKLQVEPILNSALKEIASLRPQIDQENPTIVEIWLREEYPRIQSRAKRVGAEIYFADEAGVRSDFHSGRT